MEKRMPKILNQSIQKFTGLGRLYPRGEHAVRAISEMPQFRLDFTRAELGRVPDKGPAILVANRPYGAVEELIVLKLLQQRRQDIRFMQNSMLGDVGLRHDWEGSIASLMLTADAAAAHLEKGGILVLFPVGDISNFQMPGSSFTDSKWKKKRLKFIFEARLPIVPIYIKNPERQLYRLLGMMHPLLRTRKLVTSLLANKHDAIRIRIGNPIKTADIQEFKTAAEFGKFLRARLYSLGSAIDINSFFIRKVKPEGRATPAPGQKLIHTPFDRQLLIDEVGSLRREHLLCERQEYEVFLAPYHKIPHLINEIGRLREISFREAGEGSNTYLDLDLYDLYYLHLFVWDKKASKIAGAYRIGVGDYILQTMGKKGFYIHSLFQIKDKLKPVLQSSLELGRSFVSPEYQKKRLPLFLLWRGITAYLAKHPSYEYLMGPVSISNSYSRVSRSLIYQFVRHHYFDEELARWVRPRKAFSPSYNGLNAKVLLENIKNDSRKFDRILEDIEPLHTSLPVLLKKYFAQNARIIGFNVDPKFNDALDGFMICRVKDMPENF